MKNKDGSKNCYKPQTSLDGRMYGCTMTLNIIQNKKILNHIPLRVNLHKQKSQKSSLKEYIYIVSIAT